MNSWKWTRRFRFDRDGVESQVHQHRFAAADAAPQIDAARRWRRLAGQPRPQAMLLAQLLEIGGEPVERQHRPALVLIGLELAGVEQRW